MNFIYLSIFTNTQQKQKNNKGDFLSHERFVSIKI